MAGSGAEPMTIRTTLTEMLKIQYPIMSAGMGSVASHELVAAVSNAGGFGTFGGGTMSPEAVKKEIEFLRKELIPGKPWGFDLLLPQVGIGYPINHMTHRVER